jgi:hypothetical protein
MEWILIAEIALTGIGILVGLYLTILAPQFVVPAKIRVCVIVGAMLVVIETALEIVSVWPTQDVDAVQGTNDSE